MNNLRTTFKLPKPIFYSLLLILIISCGKEDDSVFGSYLLIEDGYKNCDPGINYGINFLNEDGICDHWQELNYCTNGTLILKEDSTYLRMSTVTYTKKIDDSLVEIDTFSSEGTFSHQADQLNLNTPGGTVYEHEIDIEGRLTLYNSRIDWIGCESHDKYSKID